MLLKIIKNLFPYVGAIIVTIILVLALKFNMFTAIALNLVFKFTMDSIISPKLINDYESLEDDVLSYNRGKHIKQKVKLNSKFYNRKITFFKNTVNLFVYSWFTIPSAIANNFVIEPFEKKLGVFLIAFIITTIVCAGIVYFIPENHKTILLNKYRDKKINNSSNPKYQLIIKTISEKTKKNVEDYVVYLGDYDTNELSFIKGNMKSKDFMKLIQK